VDLVPEQAVRKKINNGIPAAYKGSARARMRAVSETAREKEILRRSVTRSENARSSRK